MISCLKIEVCTLLFGHNAIALLTGSSRVYTYFYLPWETKRLRDSLYCKIHFIKPSPLYLRGLLVRICDRTGVLTSEESRKSTQAGLLGHPGLPPALTTRGRAGLAGRPQPS